MDRMEGAAGPARHGGRESDRVGSVLHDSENRQFVAIDAVDAAIAGERAAEDLLSRIGGGTALPDALLASLQDLHAADGVGFDPTPRLRSWARRLQKALEASR